METKFEIVLNRLIRSERENCILTSKNNALIKINESFKQDLINNAFKDSVIKK